MRIAILGLGAVTAALLAVQPASAAQTFAEFTGTATVTDITGYYGTPGAVFRTPYDLVFSFNDQTPGATATSGSFPGVPQLQMLTGNDDANPVRGTLILQDGSEYDSGHDYGPPGGSAFGAVASATVDSSIDPSFGVLPGGLLGYSANSLITLPGFTFSSYVDMQVNSPSNFGLVGPVGYNRPFSYIFHPDDVVVFGNGEYLDGDPANPFVHVKFDLAVSTLTVTSDAVRGGVPEPAGWALMIAGFGVAGAGLRGRRLRAA